MRSAWWIVLAACGASRPVETTTTQQSATLLPSYDLGALHVTGAPRPDPMIGAQLDRYGAIASTRLLDISDDGKQLLVLQGGDAAILTSPLASPRTVTRDVDVVWAAFGERGAIDFAGDHDGSEDDRLYQTTSGAVKTLVSEHRIADPIERRGRLVWAQPEETSTAIWLLDGKPKKVFEGDGAWAVVDLSDDGTQLLAKNTASLESSTLYGIATSDGHAVALTSVDPRVAAPAAQFGSDGQLFAIASAGDRLNAWEIMTRGQRLLAPELAWDVTQLAVAPSGDAVAFTTNDDGANTLYVYDTRAHTHRVVTAAPVGGVIADLKFAAHADVLAFSWSDPKHPREPFTYDLASDRVTAWVAPPAIDVPVVASERVRIGDVPAFVMKPTGKAPVIIEFHGGPEDQWVAKWQPFEQFLVARGFAIVQPNVRGSVGYGRAYAAADDGPHRGEVMQDVGAVLDWIATQPDLDGSRVAVMGTSYGGYLALAALLAYPERIRAGVDIVGIADFVAFLEGTAAYRRASRRTEYGDERDPATRALLAGLSPIRRAGSIKAPLLVAQGARDPRVPPAVADGLVEAVRGGGGTVWYLAAADEGHGFQKPANLGALQTLIVQLLSAAR